MHSIIDGRPLTTKEAADIMAIDMKDQEAVYARVHRQETYWVIFDPSMGVYRSDEPLGGLVWTREQVSRREYDTREEAERDLASLRAWRRGEAEDDE